ncbi:MAG: hypothetical protein Q9228_004423 [Teloschistes exilis]
MYFLLTLLLTLTSPLLTLSAALLPPLPVPQTKTIACYGVHDRPMTCNCKCDEGYSLSPASSQGSSLGYYFCNKGEGDDSYGPVGAIYHNPDSVSPISSGSGYEGEVGKRDDGGEGDLEFVTIAEGGCVKYYSETWEGMQGV